MESREQQLEKLKQAIGKYILPCLMILFVGLLVGFEMRNSEIIDGFEINSTYDAGQDEAEEAAGSDSEEAENKTASAKASSKSSSSTKDASEKSSNNKGSDTIQDSFADAEDDVSATDNSHLPYNTVGNTLSNVLNGGFAAHQGDWIYYCEPEDQDKLYRMRENGADMKRISDHPVEFINVVGDTILARNKNYNSVISRYNTSTLEFISSIVFDSYYLTLLSDGSFISADYMYQSAIYQSYIDSFYKTTIFNDYVTKMSGVYGNNAYYIDQSNGNNLYSINLSTGKIVERISENIEFYGVNSTGIFFVSGGHLYDQKDMSTPIVDEKVGCINVTENTIFYSNLDDGEKLYSIDINGGNKVILTDCPVDAVCVAKGWIFYKTDGEIDFV